MKLLIIAFMFAINLFAGCNDSFLATVGEEAMKKVYDTNDKTISSTVSQIISSIEEDTQMDEKTFLVLKDIKKLHIDGLVEFKEINSLLESQNNLIFHQR